MGDKYINILGKDYNPSFDPDEDSKCRICINSNNFSYCIRKYIFTINLKNDSNVMSDCTGYNEDWVKVLKYGKDKR